jgi:hypothetical protein
VRLVVVATVTAALALAGCSGSRSRTEAGGGQPVVRSSTSSPPRATITPGSTASPTRAAAPTRLVVGDRADDVLHKRSEGDNSPQQVSYPRGDVRRLLISYAHRTIHVVAQIGDLRPTGSQLFELQLRTPHRTYYGDGVLRRDDPVTLSLQWELQTRGYTFTVDCPGASGRPNFARNLVIFAVPSNCLDTPPWVRLNLWTTLDEPNGAGYEDGLDDVEVITHGYTRRVYPR